MYIKYTDMEAEIEVDLKKLNITNDEEWVASD